MATFHETALLRLRGGDVWEAALRLFEPDLTPLIDSVVVQGRRGRSEAWSLAMAYHDSWQIGRTVSLYIEASEPGRELTISVELVPKNRIITARFRIEGRSRSDVLGIRESLRERCADGPTTRSKRAGSILDDELVSNRTTAHTGSKFLYSGSVFDDYIGSMGSSSQFSDAIRLGEYAHQEDVVNPRSTLMWNSALKFGTFVGGGLFLAFLVYLFGWN